MHLTQVLALLVESFMNLLDRISCPPPPTPYVHALPICLIISQREVNLLQQCCNTDANKSYAACVTCNGKVDA